MNTNTPIVEVMRKEVVTVQPGDKLINIKKIFEKNDFHHHIPVTENKELKGIVSLVDYLFHIKGASLDDNDPIYHNSTVQDIMSNKMITLNTTSTLKNALGIFSQNTIHALPVVEGNKLAGIITTTDVIKLLL